MIPTLPQPQNCVPEAYYKPLPKGKPDYMEDFVEAMAGRDIHFQGNIIADGQIHRFASKGKGDKDCWYVFYEMAGAYGDWERDIHEKWSSRNGPLSFQEREKLHRQIEKAKETAEKEIAQKQNGSALIALAKWNGSFQAGKSPYLEKKRVEALGLRFSHGSVVVPLKDVVGKLWSLQWIGPNGTKRFLAGGRKKGCFHHIGTFEEDKPIYVTEGYATGASVHMATQQTTVIALDAGNLDPVIGDLKRAIS